MIQKVKLAVVTAMLSALAIFQPAAAAEVQYFVVAGDEVPKEKVKRLKASDNLVFPVAPEPVARVTSEQVKEAIIYRDEVDAIDEDNPVTEFFRVKLVLDEADLAKLKETMKEICKTKRGVHVVFEEVAIDYRVFVLCGDFTTDVLFEDRASAEKFAQAFTKKVSFDAAVKD